MLLGKYHIVIFKEGRSGSRNLRMRGWFGFTAGLLILALIACNVWLWRAWLQARHLDENLNNAQRVIEEQRRQIVNLAGRITGVSQDLQRVQRFDSKLRMMMNMEKDPAEVGGAPGDFSRAYLPLHRQELAARDGAYGNSVEINHGGGIVTKYGHMQRWAVQPGQWVKRGEIIGYIGMSGRTTGPHLHYEVRLNGVPVNPMRYILE